MAKEAVIVMERGVKPLNAVSVNRRADGWWRDSDGILRPPVGWNGGVAAKREASPIREVKNNVAEQGGHPDNITKNEDKVAYLKRLGLTASEAEETISAVNSWSWTGFRDVRLVQNGKKAKDESDDTARRRGQVLENYIKSSPKWAGGNTYRGVALKDSEISKLKVGSVIDMMGTSSWSTSSAEAAGFAKTYAKGGRRQCVFFCKDKQKMGTSLRPVAPMAFEKEVIASKEARYKVEQIGTTKRMPGVTIIVVKSV